MEQAMTFCQSCGMPMSAPDGEYGTEADGSISRDYCKYCYNEGKFSGEMTMDQMIEFCVPYMKDQCGGEEAARNSMVEFFPKLKRWAK